MSIDRVQANGASRAYVQSTDASQTGAANAKPGKAQHHHRAAQGQDSVSLSDNARSLAAAREAVQNAPDVREGKVAEIKQRVQDGTYQVQSNVLARKIVDAYKNQP